jgi:hypothetical protein
VRAQAVETEPLAILAAAAASLGRKSEADHLPANSTFNPLAVFVADSNNWAGHYCHFWDLRHPAG